MRIFQANPGETEAQARERLRVQRIAEGHTEELLTDEEKAFLRSQDYRTKQPKNNQRTTKGQPKDNQRTT